MDLGDKQEKLRPLNTTFVLEKLGKVNQILIETSWQIIWFSEEQERSRLTILKDTLYRHHESYKWLTEFYDPIGYLIVYVFWSWEK